MWRLSFSSKRRMNIPADRVGWHRGVIGLGAGGPGATLPLGRLTYCGNWLILLPPPLLLVCFPLMSVCHYLALFFHSRWLLRARLRESEIESFAELKNLQWCRLVSLTLPAWKKLMQRGKWGWRKMMSEGKRFRFRSLQFNVRAQSGDKSCRLASFFKAVEVRLDCQLCSDLLLTFRSSIKFTVKPQMVAVTLIYFLSFVGFFFFFFLQLFFGAAGVSSVHCVTSRWPWISFN